MASVSDIMTSIQALVGKPYVWGAAGPDSFDCSGLMQYVFGQRGIQLPRTAAQQQSWATPIGSPRAGDLVFFNRPATHVGLYIGRGLMIDAPTPGKPVGIHQVGNATSYGRVMPVLSGIPSSDQPVSASGTGIDTPPSQIPGKVAGAVGDAIGLDSSTVKGVVIESLFVLGGLGIVIVGVVQQVRKGAA